MIRKVYKYKNIKYMLSRFKYNEFNSTHSNEGFHARNYDELNIFLNILNY